MVILFGSKYISNIIYREANNYIKHCVIAFHPQDCSGALVVEEVLPCHRCHTEQKHGFVPLTVNS